ncbi:MAG: hypothetical protein ABIA47_00845 [bacterium]
MKRRNFTKSHQSKIYKDKKYQNPYFQQGRRFRFPWKKILIVLVVVASIAGIAYILLFSPLFRIKSTTISGLNVTPVNEVQQVVIDQFMSREWLVLPGDNRWVFDTDKLYNCLMNEYQFVELEVDLSGSELSVIAEERITSIVWTAADRAWILDLQGNVTHEILPDTESLPPLAPTVPRILDVSGAVVEVGDSILSESLIQGVIDFDRGIRQMSLEPDYYEIEQADITWFTLKLFDSFDILFDAGQGIEGQLSALELTMGEHQDRLNELEYIDLRFGDHVYVR